MTDTSIASEQAANDEQCPHRTKNGDNEIKPTLKRYIILVLFGMNAGNKAFQWIQIPASTVKITYFYGVDNFVVNTLSVLFLLSFIFVSWPACYLIKKIGLRNAVLLGSFGTCLGSIIKCFSCHESGIVLLFVSSIIVSLSEQFIFSVPSRLASVWFPDHQVSFAVAMCIFGNQLGNALGFIVPQLVLDSAETKEQIGAGLYGIFLGLAIVSTLSFVADLVLFDEAPKHAPGAARLKQMELETEQTRAVGASFRQEMRELSEQTKQLMRNRDYIIIAIVSALMMGSKDALGTVMNQMLNPLWPGNDILIGNTGSIMVMTGVLGLPLWGKLMDRTHKYLWINMFLVFATMLSFVLFAYVVSFTRSTCAIYLAALLIGFFQTSVMASGLELAVELTYPMPEMITSSIMNVVPQLVGIPLIYIASYIVDFHGALAANIFFVAVCLLAFLMLPFLRETLRRQDAVAQNQSSY